MRLLIAEDEFRLGRNLKKGFEEEGFAVDIVDNGEEAQFMAETETYDAIILDINLPKLDGLSVCSNLRTQKINVPILILTARTTVIDKVSGLDTGADDYVTKPFAFLELRSRIHALIRRSKNEASPVLKVADLVMDPIKRTIQRGEKTLILTPKEFSLLEFMMRHQNQPVSRTMLINHVWDYNYDGLSNVVDVFIRTLRKKIDHNQKIKLIHTIHGVGYKVSDSL